MAIRWNMLSITATWIVNLRSVTHRVRLHFKIRLETATRVVKTIQWNVTQATPLIFGNALEHFISIRSTTGGCPLCLATVAVLKD